MKIKQITEALKPSQYRPLVKGWDKERYADIFTNSKYKHDKNGYRVFIPIGAVSADDTSPVQAEIESSLQQSGFEIVDYAKGIAQKKDTKQNIKIGKVLTKLKQQELLSKFNTDKTREGTKKEYMVVISRHPYDIGGMSTGRGWTSCMNLEDGQYEKYVPLDVATGALIAYVTDKNDPDLKNPTGRVSIKPFVDILGSAHVEFGIQDEVFGTKVPGFIEAVSQWVDEINILNKLDEIVVLMIDSQTYYGNAVPKVSGGSKEERDTIQSILDNPASIGDYENPSPELQLIAVSQQGDVLKYIKNPSSKVQMTAVNDDGWAIEYVNNPSPEVQLAAVKQNGRVIAYINNPSPELQMIAVKQSGIAIEYIKNPSPELQMAAIKRYAANIRHIKNPSPEVQLAAVKKFAEAIKFIKNPSPEVIAYVKQNS
jgi:hypothetical protein